MKQLFIVRSKQQDYFPISWTTDFFVKSESEILETDVIVKTITLEDILPHWNGHISKKGLKDLVKNLLIILSLFFCFSMQAQKQEESFQKKDSIEYRFIKVNSDILENKLFLETIQDAEFKTGNGAEITSKDFDYFIDDEDGAFTLPSITFTLNKGVLLNYQGKQIWKDENKEVEGYIFLSNSGQELLFRKNDSKTLIFSHLKDEGVIYELKNNSIYIECKFKEKNKVIKIE